MAASSGSRPGGSALKSRQCLIFAIILVNVTWVFIVGTKQTIRYHRVPHRVADLAHRRFHINTEGWERSPPPPPPTTTTTTTTTKTTTTTTDPMAFYERQHVANPNTDNPFTKQKNSAMAKVQAKLAKARMKTMVVHAHAHEIAEHSAHNMDHHFDPHSFANLKPLDKSAHTSKRTDKLTCAGDENAVHVALIVDGPSWYAAAAGAAYSYLYNTKNPERLRIYFVLPYESWVDGGVGGHLMCHEANQYVDKFPDEACTTTTTRRRRQYHRRRLHQGGDMLEGDVTDGGDELLASAEEDIAIDMAADDSSSADMVVEEASPESGGGENPQEVQQEVQQRQRSADEPAPAIIPCSPTSRQLQVVPFDARKFPTLEEIPDAGKHGRVALLFLSDLLQPLGVEDVLVVPTSAVAEMDVVAAYERSFPRGTGRAERAITRSDEGNCASSNDASFDFDQPAVASLAREVPSCLSPDACLADIGVARLHLPTFGESGARREAEELARRAWMSGDNTGSLWRRSADSYGVDVERALVLALCRAEADAISRKRNSLVNQDGDLFSAEGSAPPPVSYAGPSKLPRDMDVVLYYSGVKMQARVPHGAIILRWPGPPWPWEFDRNGVHPSGEHGLHVAFHVHWFKYQMGSVFQKNARGG
ncbi:hypothetical protein RI054_13g65460 [Pseudoscourfieldia marina]